MQTDETILLSYMKDLRELAIKKLDNLATGYNDSTAQEESIKLTAIIQEFIKVRKLIMQK